METIVQTHGDSIRPRLKYSGAQEIPSRSPRFSPPADLLGQRASQQRLKYEDRVALSVCGCTPQTIYVYMHLASFADSEALHQKPAKACSHLAG